jgi:predicted DNA binding CopG/RHH family protein
MSLEKAMKGITKKDLAKSETIIFRVSSKDKDQMQKTAKKLGLSLTEYLTRLHQIAVEQLK